VAIGIEPHAIDVEVGEGGEHHNETDARDELPRSEEEGEVDDHWTKEKVELHIENENEEKKS